jgi:hypothetical protein
MILFFGIAFVAMISGSMKRNESGVVFLLTYCSFKLPSLNRFHSDSRVQISLNCIPSHSSRFNSCYIKTRGRWSAPTLHFSTMMRMSSGLHPFDPGVGPDWWLSKLFFPSLASRYLRSEISRERVQQFFSSNSYMRSRLDGFGVVEFNSSSFNVT